MVKITYLKGYDNFIRFMDELKYDKDEIVNVYFSGSKDDEGVSWCPDCVEAEPFLRAALAELANEETKLIYVDVGDKAFWKDIKNPFRTNKLTHLSVIPTIIRWKHVERLEGEQITNPDLLKMFFSVDDS